MKWDYHENRRHLKPTSKRIIWIENVHPLAVTWLSIEHEIRMKIELKYPKQVFMHCDHDRINHRYGPEILNSHGYSVSEASADLFQPNGYQNTISS